MKIRITILISFLAASCIAGTDDPVEISIVDLIHKTEAGEVRTAEYHNPSYKQGIRGVMIQDGEEVNYRTCHFGESDDRLLRFFHDHDVKTRRYPRQGWDLVESFMMFLGMPVLVMLFIIHIVVVFSLKRQRKATNQKVDPIN